MLGRLLGALINMLHSQLSNPHTEKHIQKVVVNKLADSKTFQKLVLNTNKIVADQHEKLMRKIDQNKTIDAMANRGSTWKSTKEFLNIYKDELKKDLSTSKNNNKKLK